MRGSDPGGIGERPSAPEGPWGESALTKRHGPKVRESVYRLPLLGQLRLGAWPFAISVAVPGAVVAGLLIAGALGGEETRSIVAMVAGPVLALGMVPLVFVVVRGAAARSPATATCGWIALGAGYIRLGMSFMRAKMLFEQIVSVERGDLSRRKWVAATDGELPEAAPPVVAPGGAGASAVMSPPLLGPAGGWVRLRIVTRPNWGVAPVAYPAELDPACELTRELRRVAEGTRAAFGIHEGASDQEVTALFRGLQERYEAERAAEGVAPASIEDLIRVAQQVWEPPATPQAPPSPPS